MKNEVGPFFARLAGRVTRPYRSVDRWLMKNWPRFWGERYLFIFSWTLVLILLATVIAFRAADLRRMSDVDDGRRAFFLASAAVLLAWVVVRTKFQTQLPPAKGRESWWLAALDLLAAVLICLPALAYQRVFAWKVISPFGSEERYLHETCDLDPLRELWIVESYFFVESELRKERHLDNNQFVEVPKEVDAYFDGLIGIMKSSILSNVFDPVLVRDSAVPWNVHLTTWFEKWDWTGYDPPLRRHGFSRGPSPPKIWTKEMLNSLASKLNTDIAKFDPTELPIFADNSSAETDTADLARYLKSFLPFPDPLHVKPSAPDIMMDNIRQADRAVRFMQKDGILVTPNSSYTDRIEVDPKFPGVFTERGFFFFLVWMVCCISTMGLAASAVTPKALTYGLGLIAVVELTLRSFVEAPDHRTQIRYAFLGLGLLAFCLQAVFRCFRKRILLDLCVVMLFASLAYLPWAFDSRLPNWIGGDQPWNGQFHVTHSWLAFPAALLLLIIARLTLRNIAIMPDRE